MRDKERIDRIIQKLAAVWILSPQQRLMQLLLNVITYDGIGDLFYLEDDKLEKMLDDILLERGWQ